MLSIVKYPSHILSTPSSRVQKITKEIQDLLPLMAETMEKHDGVGLAAPQIGRTEQVIIVNTEEGNHAFLNPKLISLSKKTEIEEEGCLSLPGLFVLVKRSFRVKVSCQTPEGSPIIIEAEGLAARIFQHEIDHLNGKLIINRISPLKRLKIRKQLKDIKEKGFTEIKK